MFLEQHLQELQQNIKYIDIVHNKVSQVSVGWHIDHSLIVIRDIMKQVIESNPDNYRWKFNLWRMVVLWLGFIPRWRAKAPDFTIPRNTITAVDILHHLHEIKELMPAFEALQDNHKFLDHPFFGKLTLSQSKKNLVVHTNHHLKIIRDILKQHT